jgi:hypothetical protein
VEDGIDSSKDAGKLMISVLSAVAEIERENILVQTMEGCKQKAREGKWNGGFAPYGYRLINGELHIAEDEAEVIRIIYDKYVNTTMGIAAIANFLNNSGYKKKLRQNNTIEGFSTSFVKGVLDNPVYSGKLAFGRRKNEKIPGTRNEYHVVKQETYMLNDGIHEGIVSEELWNQANKKRKETGVANVKTHSLDHEHILSGIIKCPICGSGMYGNVNRKKHPDGGHYRDYFYYACKHRTYVNGHKCTYRKQWNEDKINAAVEEVIRKLVNNPKFKTEIQKNIGNSIDTAELDREHDGLEERLKQVTGAKNRLANQMDSLMEFWDIHRFYHGIAELERKDAIFTCSIVGHTIRVKMDTYIVIDFIKESFKYLGYKFKGDVLNAASYGVPQTRERYILIGIKRELITGEIELPEPIISNPRDYVTVKEAIKDLEKIEPTVERMDETQKRKNCPVINSYFRKLVMVEKYRDVHNHVCTATRETALQRFEQIEPGKNFHSLPDELKSSYENPGRTQNTVYKRLDPNLPSDTVVNVRKSMWIHPVFNIAVSAREAARLQSFPDDYIFYGTKDSVYQQIGNAVPPVLGRAVAEKVLGLFGQELNAEETLKGIYKKYLDR